MICSIYYSKCLTKLSLWRFDMRGTAWSYLDLAMKQPLTRKKRMYYISLHFLVFYSEVLLYSKHNMFAYPSQEYISLHFLLLHCRLFSWVTAVEESSWWHLQQLCRTTPGLHSLKVNTPLQVCAHPWAHTLLCTMVWCHPGLGVWLLLYKF